MNVYMHSSAKSSQTQKSSFLKAYALCKPCWPSDNRFHDCEWYRGMEYVEIDSIIQEKMNNANIRVCVKEKMMNWVDSLDTEIEVEDDGCCFYDHDLVALLTQSQCIVCSWETSIH